MDKEMYLKIARPQNACVQCGAEIANAGKHHSVLLPETDLTNESQEPVRQDYCPACWEKIRQNSYFSFWLARREKPKTPKLQSRKERNATLLSYFDYLHQQDDAENAQHLFFLAHLLMKFSVFKWVRNEPPTEQGGRERIIFRNTTTDDFIAIDSVELQEERIGAIKKEIDEFLNRSPQEPEAGD